MSSTWRHADGSVRVDHMDSRPGDYFGPPPESELSATDVSSKSPSGDDNPSGAETAG